MEVAMRPDQEVQDETDYHWLPPERWELIKDDALVRARQARSQTIREVGSWVGAQVAAGARYLFNSYRTWRTRRAAAFELRSLDDRSLRDIGVNRSEIESVVRGWDSSRLPRGQARAPRPRQPLPGAPGRKAAPARQAIEKNAA
jgi:uncharacterized protein YjiS (DUF1127 family)